MVDFVTFCYPGDYRQLHHPGWLDKVVKGHSFPFTNVYVLHQGMNGIDYPPLPDYVKIVPVDETVIEKYIKLPDEDAEKFTGPPNRAHYYLKHVRNHAMGLEVSQADYILFQDADVFLKEDESDMTRSWITIGMEILQTNPDVLVVCPHWGGADCIVSQHPWGWKCNRYSQQIFLCERQRLKNMDWEAPWDWEHLPEGGPLQEYWGMLEGRMDRYARMHGLYRAAVNSHRYWHTMSGRCFPGDVSRDEFLRSYLG